MKRLMANHASGPTLREEARKMKVASLFQDAWTKAGQGITTISVVLGKISYYGPEKKLTHPTKVLQKSREDYHSILALDRP